jgi:DNA-binding Xre family transcriptional regulator
MKTFNLKCEKPTIIIVEEELSLPQYIGQRVKQISQQKKLSFTTIAKIGGLTNNTICHRVITGKWNITTETLYKLCKGLDCKSSDLLPF